MASLIRVTGTGGLGFALASWVLPAAASGADDPSPLRFVDVTAEAGIDAVIWCGGPDKDHLLESTGSGAAFVDLDGDGRLDILLVNAWALDEEPSGPRIKGRNVFYRNLGDGRFADLTEAAGLGDEQWGCGVCAGDYDNDGLVDLYVTNFGPNRLYRNLGGGRFEEVGGPAGVDDPGWGAGAAFFDADRDGDLDLYVANYVDCTIDDVLAARRTNLWRSKAKVMAGPFGMRGGRDRFFRNQGDGTFVDAAAACGLTDIAEAYGLGVLTSDLDDDGDVDVYVANDSNPNFLYRNDGDGTFTEVGAWSGAAFSAQGAAQAGMGVDAGDFDNDGRQDIFVTNFARDHCTLYRNIGELFFEDVSAPSMIRTPTFLSLSWGCAFFDADLDGDLDICVVNGHIYPQVDEYPELEESYQQRPLLLRNDGGRFADVSDGAGPGFQSPLAGRGLAVGDYDGDGDLDLLMTAMDAPPRLLRNDSVRAGHWITLRLLDRHGGPAIGAVARVTAGGVTQLRESRSGSTYQSQNSLDLHFGLGDAAEVELVEVRWPSGSTSARRGLEADQTITLRQAGETEGTEK